MIQSNNPEKLASLRFFTMGCFSLELFARRAGYTEVIYQGLYQRIRFLGERKRWVCCEKSRVKMQFYQL